MSVASPSSETLGRDRTPPPPPRPTGKPKGVSGPTPPDGGTSAGSSCRLSHRRHCGQTGCSKTLPSATHDAHTVCIACRRLAGFQCAPDSRCNECCSWTPEQVQSAHAFQVKLGKSKAKGKGSSASGKCSPSSPVSPVDSELQSTPSEQVNQQLASLLSGSSFKDVLTSMITDTVKSLLPDMSLISASSEARQIRTATGVRGPLSAPPTERYIRSPGGLLRGALSGPEPTTGGDNEGASAHTRR